MNETEMDYCLWYYEHKLMLYCCGFILGNTTHLQSMARPLGQPRVVFTIDRACDPSPQARMIFAGRYQSVQKI